jgi:hypothetical protein
MERFNNRTRDGGGGACRTLGHFNRCASPVLSRTQLVKRLEHQTDLLSVFGFRVHFLKAIHQRGIFGT